MIKKIKNVLLFILLMFICILPKNVMAWVASDNYDSPNTPTSPDAPVSPGESNTCSGAGCYSGNVGTCSSGPGCHVPGYNDLRYYPGKVNDDGTVSPGQYVYDPNGIGDPNCKLAGSSCVVSANVIRIEVSLGSELYDMNNNLIYNLDRPKDITSWILAGTYFGARIYEERTAYWSASGVLHQYYNCARLVPDGTCCCTYDRFGDGYEAHCETVWKPYLYTRDEYVASAACQSEADRLGYDLAKRAVEIGSSYKMNLSDPNDARCQNVQKYKDELDREGVKCENYVIEARPGKTSAPVSNPVKKKYYYEKYGTCIDVKTSKVRYLNSEADKCNENEYYVKNDDENDETRHWHTFIPLNAKESEGYTFLLENTDKVEIPGICRDTINIFKKEKMYIRVVKPLKNQKFTGNITTDMAMVSKGCYFYTIVDIPLSQAFYNEVDNKLNDTSELIGFNFYYRPIDIDNPFPNGITKYSYWEKWGEDKKHGKEDPELEKSFNTITYAATNIDLNYIREYNGAMKKTNERENQYTDWSKMNIDGSSIFIQKDNIINRNGLITNKSFYSLGCGPQNQCEYLDKEQKVRNPIYLPECKNNKTTDICPMSHYK